jgi:hypothetical protein
MKKYYIADGKLRTTTSRITKKWIYTKNQVWRNNIGTVYNNKESAIISHLRELNDIKNNLISAFEAERMAHEKEIKSIDREYNKWEKELK